MNDFRNKLHQKLNLSVKKQKKTDQGNKESVLITGPISFVDTHAFVNANPHDNQIENEV